MKKYLWILGDVLLVVLLIGLLFVQGQNQRGTRVQLEQARVKLLELQSKKEKLESSLSADSNQSATKKGQYHVLICFTNVKNIVSDQLLSSVDKDVTDAVILLADGQIPGNANAISTEDCVKVIDAGWLYGISMGKDAALSDQNWENALDSYLDQLKARVNKEPKVYRFGTNEYSETRAAALEKRGFQILLYDKAENVKGQTKLPLLSLISADANPETVSKSSVAVLFDADGQSCAEQIQTLANSSQVTIYSPEKMRKEQQENTVSDQEQKRVQKQITAIEQEMEQIVSSENRTEN